MKIRTGFVSNSSSSSFIVVFEEPELTVEYIKKTLYCNADRIGHIYDSCDCFIVDDLCRTIKQTLKPATNDDIVNLFNTMSSYDDDRYPQFPEYNSQKTPEDREREWAVYDSQRLAIATKLANEFLSSIKEGQHVFIGEFEDDTRMGSQLEHGGTFTPIRHKRINHH